MSGLFFWRPDHGVEFAVARLLREIGAELFEHTVGRARRGIERVATRVHRALADEVVERAANVVARHAHAAEHLERGALALAHDAEQEVLGGDVGLTHLHRLAQ